MLILDKDRLSEGKKSPAWLGEENSGAKKNTNQYKPLPFRK